MSDVQIRFNAFARIATLLRSLQIRSVVQRLQDKVISGAILQLKTRTLAEKKMAPIHTWTRLARVVSGSFDGPLSKAFSQVPRAK